MSVGFFFLLHNMLGNIEMNDDTTNYHAALTSYFTNPSFKKTVLFEILSLRNADDISIVMTASATMFEPAIFVRSENATYRLVIVIPVH